MNLIIKGFCNCMQPLSIDHSDLTNGRLVGAIPPLVYCNPDFVDSLNIQKRIADI